MRPDPSLFQVWNLKIRAQRFSLVSRNRSIRTHKKHTTFAHWFYTPFPSLRDIFGMLTPPLGIVPFPVALKPSTVASSPLSESTVTCLFTWKSLVLQYCGFPIKSNSCCGATFFKEAASSLLISFNFNEGSPENKPDFRCFSDLQIMHTSQLIEETAL